MGISDILCVLIGVHLIQKVPCEIEGSKPLLITLTGTCIEQVPLKEVYNSFKYLQFLNMLC